jgi:hypothetical protein
MSGSMAHLITSRGPKHVYDTFWCIIGAVSSQGTELEDVARDFIKRLQFLGYKKEAQHCHNISGALRFDNSVPQRLTFSHLGWISARITDNS